MTSSNIEVLNILDVLGLTKKDIASLRNILLKHIGDREEVSMEQIILFAVRDMCKSEKKAFLWGFVIGRFTSELEMRVLVDLFKKNQVGA